MEDMGAYALSSILQSGWSYRPASTARHTPRALSAATRPSSSARSFLASGSEPSLEAGVSLSNLH